MTDDTYLSIANESNGLYKEKGSKFLAFAFPVKNEAEVRKNLETVKRKYHDARHHCYAYMIGKEKEIFRANDDGEPNHSAGDPILGQIKAKDLSDILIIVVRYFGGIKLGVGGLITAYKTAAAEAIMANKIIEKVITVFLKMDFEYSSLNDVMKIVKAYDLAILNQEFNLQCKIQVTVREKFREEVLSKLQKFGSVERL